MPARLDDVQKVLTGIKKLDGPTGWDLMGCGAKEPDLPYGELNP
jgi:hypothetical protein